MILGDPKVLSKNKKTQQISAPIPVGAKRRQRWRSKLQMSAGYVGHLSRKPYCFNARYLREAPDAARMHEPRPATILETDALILQGTAKNKCMRQSKKHSKKEQIGPKASKRVPKS